jgi:hypothetical protein
MAAANPVVWDIFPLSRRIDMASSRITYHRVCLCMQKALKPINVFHVNHTYRYLYVDIWLQVKFYTFELDSTIQLHICEKYCKALDAFKQPL